MTEKERVLGAQAKRRAMTGRELLRAVLALLDDWHDAYPQDVFLPLAGDAERASPDRVAAHMARHMARELRRQVIAAYERGAEDADP